MDQPPTPSSALPSINPAVFRQRLTILTLGLLLVVLIIHLLREFQAIFQPLFVAVFIGYLILPLHQWLVRRVPSALAYVVILLLVVGTLFGLGSMVYGNIQEVLEPARWDAYEKKLDGLLQRLAKASPVNIPGGDQLSLRDLPLFGDNSAALAAATLRAAVGTFLDFFSALAITFVYLLFLVAEKISFPQRIELAFGSSQGQQIMNVAGSINQAIAQYLAVKTFVSVLAGLLSLGVLAAFRVDFFVMWSVLICVLNFIPYIGSLVAVVPPIVLGFLQFDSMVPGLVILGLLILIQMAIGYGIEPRLAGQKLNVSPLLIVLSLSFWGLIWGIVGMILAVPLLVVGKIVLDNITQTKPLATLISNV